MNNFTQPQSELASGSTQARHVPGANNHGTQPGSVALCANADFAIASPTEAHETSDPTRDGEGVPRLAGGCVNWSKYHSQRAFELRAVAQSYRDAQAALTSAGDRDFAEFCRVRAAQNDLWASDEEDSAKRFS